ncbi:MAG: gamma carbonic anhydrase family protein [Bacillota bacterium]
MILSYKGIKPEISDSVFLAQNCTIIGKCVVEEGCSIWFNTVLRADVNEIRVGKNTNIQDGVVVHCDHNHPTSIGENVTVGHNAIVHGCTIGSNCIIGMGSTILDGAVIGKNCIVGANSLVTSGKTIPDNSLIIGSPAKVIRELSAEEAEAIKKSAEGYYRLSREYLE